MSRGARAQQGQESVLIAKRGWYENKQGQRVDIFLPMQHCLAETTLHRPEELKRLVDEIGAPQSMLETEFEVRNETTLSAARRLIVDRGLPHVLCLNFASARNPGGGFLGGSQAQEESLARSSALYPSLLKQPDYYIANKAFRSGIYTDHMIISPNVPVFRDDNGQLLDEPYFISMVTSPAVNAGAIANNDPHLIEQILPMMVSRTHKLLALAAMLKYEHLILGAWGCGVFRNDPQAIAQVFADSLLHDQRFRGRFASVSFAVLDASSQQTTYQPFAQLFSAKGTQAARHVHS